MKKLLCIVLILCPLYLIAQPNLKDWNMQENIIGKHAMALGGAGVAFVNDYNATYWNPANLALLEGISFGADYTTRIHFNRSPNEIHSFASGKEDLNSIGLAIPFKINHIRAGFGVNYYRKYNFLDKAEYTYNAVAESVETHGGHNVLAFGFAVGDSNLISLGVSYNLLRGNATRNEDNSNSNYEWTTEGHFLEFGINSLFFDRLRVAAKINKKYNSSDSQKLNNTTTNWKTDYPLAYSIGAELNLTRFFRIDYNFKKNDWSKATYSINEKAPAIPASDIATSSSGLGIELGQKQNGFWAFGINKRKNLSLNAENEQITSTGFSFGFGVWGKSTRWNTSVMYDVIDSYLPEDDKSKILYIGTELSFTIKSSKI